MFHKEIIDRRIWQIQKSLPSELKRYSVAEALERTKAIPAWNKRRKAPEQPLTEDQQQFIVNEMILSTWDFNYWINRYSMVIAMEGRRVPMVL